MTILISYQVGQKTDERKASKGIYFFFLKVGSLYYIVTEDSIGLLFMLEE